MLVHWVSIASGNGLSPFRRQAITWTSAHLLSTGHLGTNFSEIWIGILSFSLKKMRSKMWSDKWRSFCPGWDELMGVSGSQLNLIASSTMANHTWLMIKEIKALYPSASLFMDITHHYQLFHQYHLRHETDNNHVRWGSWFPTAHRQNMVQDPMMELLQFEFLLLRWINLSINWGVGSYLCLHRQCMYKHNLLIKLPVLFAWINVGKYSLLSSKLSPADFISIFCINSLRPSDSFFLWFR